METRVVVVRADRDPMKGVAAPGPHQIYRNPTVTIERREMRELHPDEIRVEMIYAGICGTHVHLVETNSETGYIRGSAPARIPPEGRVIGHEGVGRVMAIGSHVRHVKPGALVTFESIIVCHYCDVLPTRSVQPVPSCPAARVAEGWAVRHGRRCPLNADPRRDTSGR